MLIFNIISISGIFGSSKDLDILPPPPPFPEIGGKEKELKEIEKERKNGEKKRIKELEIKKKKEVKKRLEEEKKRKELDKKRQRELELKKKEEEKNKKKKLISKKLKKIGKKKGREKFVLLEKLGLTISKEEKEKIAKQRQENKRLKRIAKQEQWEEKKRKEVRKKEEREPIFGTLFGEKEVDKALGELEKITPKAKKEEKIKLEIPKIRFEKGVEKPHEIIKSEEEIQKAIESIKEIKRKKPSVLSGLFKKRKETKVRVERPEVMPRVEEKVDTIMLIEERIHKARLSLMDFKFDETKKIYVEIMRMYNELDPKKKAKVYHDIKDLYYERKSAEKYAK